MIRDETLTGAGDPKSVNSSPPDSQRNVDMELDKLNLRGIKE